MRIILVFLYGLDAKACLIYFVSSVKAKQLIVSCRTVGAISFCSGHQKLYMSVNCATSFCYFIVRLDRYSHYYITMLLALWRGEKG